MQKLLAIFAAALAFHAAAATEDGKAEPSPQGNAAVSNAPASQDNAVEKSGRTQSFTEAQRSCATRMQIHSPRGRSAPNWFVYDQCMKERGYGRG